MQPGLGPSRLASPVQPMRMEANMKRHFSAGIIAALAMVIVAVAPGSLCSTSGRSAGPDVADVSGARGETAAIVLAQYNPCPNGKCRR